MTLIGLDRCRRQVCEVEVEVVVVVISDLVG